MRFIHTSDWHLGRQLHGVSLLEDQRVILDQIAALAQQHDVDALIVAGDIYDRSVPPADAISLLDTFVQSMLACNIKVILTAGNHDGAQRLSFAAQTLANQGLYIIGPLHIPITPITLTGKHSNTAVDFYPLPYADPQTVRHVFDQDVSSHDVAISLLSQHCLEHANSVATNNAKVAISHCFIDGGDESDSERPLSIGGADRVSPSHFLDFDYTALGHLHGRQYKGAEHIRYCGSILKYSFSETKQQKAVTLVDIDADGLRHQQLELKPQRDLRIVEGSLQSILEAAPNDPNANDYLLARLSDTHAILDVMGKLREVYPNTLHVERPALQSLQGVKADRQILQQNEEDIVTRFFEQVNGNPLSAAQAELLHNSLSTLHKESH